MINAKTLMKSTTQPVIAILATTALLGSCAQAPEQPADSAESDPAAGQAEETPETISILRSDIEAVELPEAPLEPLNATIGFPNGGSELDEAAKLAIMDAASSEQLLLQGPIILRGHSDAGGNDAANLRASQARAQSVQDFMIDLGVEESRFTIIAFGAQNPIEPNALPDGSPNEVGRALNRRVEVLIAPPAGVRIETDPSAQTSN